MWCDGIFFPPCMGAVGGVVLIVVWLYCDKAIIIIQLAEVVWGMWWWLLGRILHSPRFPIGGGGKTKCSKQNKMQKKIGVSTPPLRLESPKPKYASNKSHFFFLSFFVFWFLFVGNRHSLCFHTMYSSTEHHYT